MTLEPFSDARIIDSWRKNAAPWTTAVREHQIESRRLVTDRAVVDAALSRSPVTALDIGCGEGWLVRALAEHGVRTIGVDVVPELIDQATRQSAGEFRVASYEDIVAGAFDLVVDLVVANFSLIGYESVNNLVAFTPRLLSPGGTLIVQTLHPVVATGALPYRDGWRGGSWVGFDAAFSDPPPWYFRTIESWVRLVGASGLRLLEVREPLHPISGVPASIIFIATAPG
ncbi:MAG: methyltransferase domain-containing protein [bacterium]